MIEWTKLERRSKKALEAGDDWHKDMPMVPPQQVLGMMLAIKLADNLANTLMQVSAAAPDSEEAQAKASEAVQQAYMKYVQVRQVLEGSAESGDEEES